MKYAIYKGMTGKYGAVQFQLSPPKIDENGNGVREGAVFVEITKATGPNVYDWNSKITFALSVNDLGKVLTALRNGTECTLLHDPGAQTTTQGQVTKNFRFTLQTEKGMLLSVRETNKVVPGNDKNYSIPMSPDEVSLLGTLVLRAIPACLGW